MANISSFKQGSLGNCVQVFMCSSVHVQNPTPLTTHLIPHSTFLIPHSYQSLHLPWQHRHKPEIIPYFFSKITTTGFGEFNHELIISRT